MKQLYETIMRGNEMFEEMNCAKTNDQQWYGVVPDACDVRKTWTCPDIEFRCLDGGKSAKETTNLLRMQQLCASLRKISTLSNS